MTDVDATGGSPTDPLVSAYDHDVVTDANLARFAGHPCSWPENRYDLSQAVRVRSHLFTADAIAAVAALHEDGIL